MRYVFLFGLVLAVLFIVPSGVFAQTPQPAASPAVTAEAPIQLPEVNPMEMKGPVVSAGSSTVYPLSEKIASMFKDEGFQGNMTIDNIGSGAGFERFCKAGETDISNASRKINDTELAACQKIGRQPLAFRIGTDGIAVVVSKDNTFVKDVTSAELAKIYSDAEMWSDVNPSWPKERILRFSPGTDSGTFDYFVEVILGKGKDLLLKAKNLQLSEDDNVLVQGVEGSPYAIGYFGYAYYNENKDRLNALSIDGVVPSAETVEANKYKLSRPLFIYTTADIMKAKTQVNQLINYYLSNVNDVIGKVGYFPASVASLNAAKQMWLDVNQKK